MSKSPSVGGKYGYCLLEPAAWDGDGDSDLLCRFVFIDSRLFAGTRIGGAEAIGVSSEETSTCRGRCVRQNMWRDVTRSCHHVAQDQQSKEGNDQSTSRTQYLRD